MDCQRGNSNVIQACQGASGSTFALGVYEGWNPLSDSFWAAKVQTVDSLPSGAISEKGIADVLFDDGPDVNLPIAVWNNPTMQLVYGVSSPAKSVLGMGPKSDLLQTLLNASMIPSKFMGLFFGSRSLNRPVDGELLIGGWDKSRVNGSFVNYTIAAFPMSIGCPLRVKVKRVILSNDRGSHPMLDEGQTVLACIDPVGPTSSFRSANGN
jgi:hypothetical protein